MPKVAFFSLFVLFASLTGCSTYQVGSKHDSEPNGSYSGYTMNSPVADDNPHVGGDQSYPSSPAEGKPLAPPDKSDGR